MAEGWRQGKGCARGAYIDDDCPRREAFNIVFSMPVRTPPEAVPAATAKAARQLFEGHKYVFVMHEDQGRHTCVFRSVPIGTTACACRRARRNLIGGVQCLPGTYKIALSMQWPAGSAASAANRNCCKLWEERAADRGQLTWQRPAQRTSARALAVRADAIKAW